MPAIVLNKDIEPIDDNKPKVLTKPTHERKISIDLPAMTDPTMRKDNIVSRSQCFLKPTTLQSSLVAEAKNRFQTEEIEQEDQQPLGKSINMFRLNNSKFSNTMNNSSYTQSQNFTIKPLKKPNLTNNNIIKSELSGDIKAFLNQQQLETDTMKSGFSCNSSSKRAIGMVNLNKSNIAFNQAAGLSRNVRFLDNKSFFSKQVEASQFMTHEEVKLEEIRVNIEKANRPVKEKAMGVQFKTFDTTKKRINMRDLNSGRVAKDFMAIPDDNMSQKLLKSAVKGPNMNVDIFHNSRRIASKDYISIQKAINERRKDPIFIESQKSLENSSLQSSKYEKVVNMRLLNTGMNEFGFRDEPIPEEGEKFNSQVMSKYRMTLYRNNNSQTFKSDK